MARTKLFTEDAKLKLPGNSIPEGTTNVEFTSDVTGAPGSGFPSGTHKNEGKGTITRNGDNINASYEGKLTIGGQPCKWTSREKSKRDGRGNVNGEEVIIENLPGFPPRLTISMETTMEDTTMKNEKKVTNIGYR